MTMGGCCLATRTCRLSSCARSRPRAVLFLRAHMQPSQPRSMQPSRLLLK